MTILPKAIYRFNVIPIKLLMAFFTELEPNFIIYIETQKTLNSQSYLEREKIKRSYRNQAPWFQTPLQSYSNKDSMALTQKQKYRLMEQDIKPRDKRMHPWLPNLWQKKQEYTMQKRQFLQWYWGNWTVTCKRLKLEHSITPHTKIN